MNTARVQHTATLLLNGQVLATGGGAGTAELYNPTPGKRTITGSVNSCDLFEPSTGDELLTASMHTAHDRQTATALQNTEVLAAGEEAQDEKGNFFYTSTAELFTP